MKHQISANTQILVPWLCVNLDTEDDCMKQKKKYNQNCYVYKTWFFYELHISNFSPYAKDAWGLKEEIGFTCELLLCYINNIK